MLRGGPTLDHISGGRAEYGIGAAWFEPEHQQYGIPFPRLGVRMDMLDEACQVMRGLWTQERFSFAGEHYRLEDAQMLGAGDFLLAAYAPYDWQSLELFAREVAPALSG